MTIWTMPIDLSSLLPFSPLTTHLDICMCICLCTNMQKLLVLWFWAFSIKWRMENAQNQSTQYNQTTIPNYARLSGHSMQDSQPIKRRIRRTLHHLCHPFTLRFISMHHQWLARLNLSIIIIKNCMILANVFCTLPQLHNFYFSISHLGKFWYFGIMSMNIYIILALNLFIVHDNES